MPQEVQRRAIEKTVVKRAGTPEEAAQLVVFVAESDFSTGMVFAVDGGRRPVRPRRSGPSVPPRFPARPLGVAACSVPSPPVSLVKIPPILGGTGGAEWGRDIFTTHDA